MNSITKIRKALSYILTELLRQTSTELCYLLLGRPNSCHLFPLIVVPETYHFQRNYYLFPYETYNDDGAKNNCFTFRADADLMELLKHCRIECHSMQLPFSQVIDELVFNDLDSGHRVLLVRSGKAPPPSLDPTLREILSISVHQLIAHWNSMETGALLFEDCKDIHSVADRMTQTLIDRLPSPNYHSLMGIEVSEKKSDNILHLIRSGINTCFWNFSFFSKTPEEFANTAPWITKMQSLSEEYSSYQWWEDLRTPEFYEKIEAFYKKEIANTIDLVKVIADFRHGDNEWWLIARHNKRRDLVEKKYGKIQNASYSQKHDSNEKPESLNSPEEIVRVISKYKSDQDDVLLSFLLLKRKTNKVYSLGIKKGFQVDNSKWSLDPSIIFDCPESPLRLTVSPHGSIDQDLLTKELHAIYEKASKKALELRASNVRQIKTIIQNAISMIAKEHLFSDVYHDLSFWDTIRLDSKKLILEQILSQLFQHINSSALEYLRKYSKMKNGQRWMLHAVKALRRSEHVHSCFLLLAIGVETGDCCLNDNSELCFKEKDWIKTWDIITSLKYITNRKSGFPVIGHQHTTDTFVLKIDVSDMLNTPSSGTENIFWEPKEEPEEMTCLLDTEEEKTSHAFYCLRTSANNFCLSRDNDHWILSIEYKIQKMK